MSRGMTAYLQTPGQERALLPGGWLQGRVDLAVIEPFFARTDQYADHYSLADIKAANPGMKVLAYTNGAVVSSRPASLGPLQTGLDTPTAQAKGWLVPAPSPDQWPATKAADLGGTRYVAYQDYPGTFLARIDMADYRAAFVAFARTLLSTPSHSVHGAPDAFFDGIVLDDTNMSPQHGLDLDASGGAPENDRAPVAFDPWASNDDYGRDMADFAVAVAEGVKLGFSTEHQPIVMCNLGANPWTRPLRHLALSLASRRVAGGPAIDRMLREFTTTWYAASSDLGVDQILEIVQLAHDLADRGVALDLADQGRPAADPKGGPTDAERAGWTRQQRLLHAVSILAQKPGAEGAPSCQPVMVHDGRNQWGSKALAEDMSAPVGDLAVCAPARATGPVRRRGAILSRQTRGGQVHVNLSATDQTVDGIQVPARDAVIDDATA